MKYDSIFLFTVFRVILCDHGEVKYAKRHWSGRASVFRCTRLKCTIARVEKFPLGVSGSVWHLSVLAVLLGFVLISDAASFKERRNTYDLR
jgi:hypothetical protein